MLRSSHTSSGRPESVAEHTWRPCLMALMLRNEFPKFDFPRLIRTCIVHDPGETITGDVPAIDQDAATPKQSKSVSACSISSAVAERTPRGIGRVVGDYESVSSPEARLVKALDKLETIMVWRRRRSPAGCSSMLFANQPARWQHGANHMLPPSARLAWRGRPPPNPLAACGFR